MNDERSFSLGTVLSVTTGRLVAPGGIDDIYEILNFLTGETLVTHQIPRAIHTCQPYLQVKFPLLAKDHLESDLDDLNARLAIADSPETTVQEWVASLIERFGPSINLHPLPPNLWQRRDPVEETISMREAP